MTEDTTARERDEAESCVRMCRSASVSLNCMAHADTFIQKRALSHLEADIAPIVLDSPLIPLDERKMFKAKEVSQTDAVNSDSLKPSLSPN